MARGGYRFLKYHEASILSREDSLKRVSTNCERDSYKGFIRFGDGEYQLMNGLSIGFQHASKSLSTDLKCALHNEMGLDIDIAIDAPSYAEIQNMGFYKKVSFLPWSYFFVNESDSGRQYLYTGFTVPYFLDKRKDNYDKDKVSAYIEDFIRLFAGKKVTLFIGEGIYKKIKYLPFQNSTNVVIEQCPSSDSYSEIDSILQRARKYPKDRLLCFVIGPASKVVSYKLMGEGYRCFDLGHFIKDYDMFKKMTEKSEIFLLRILNR